MPYRRPAPCKPPPQRPAPCGTGKNRIPCRTGSKAEACRAAGACVPSGACVPVRSLCTCPEPVCRRGLPSGVRTSERRLCCSDRQGCPPDALQPRHNAKASHSKKAGAGALHTGSLRSRKTEGLLLQSQSAAFGSGPQRNRNRAKTAQLMHPAGRSRSPLLQPTAPVWAHLSISSAEESACEPSEYGSGAMRRPRSAQFRAAYSSRCTKGNTEPGGFPTIFRTGRTAPRLSRAQRRK